MIVKRFTLTNSENAFQEMKCGIDDRGKTLTFIEVVNELNELHEDNQLLHKMNANAIDFMYDNFDLNIMFTDRELNDICNEMGWELSEKGIKINQLEKENEQLKQQLFETRKDYILETYADNPVRRDEKLKELEKEL